MAQARAHEPRRVLIVGNSGSGKSTLAAELARSHGLAHLDLDPLAWLSTTPPARVPLEEAERHIRAFTAEHTQWVVEGCYADLLELLRNEANELVFLDLPVAQCQANARCRPFEPHKYASKQAQDENLAMLLSWIADYPEREGVLGRAAHLALYEAFVGKKEQRTTQPG